MRIADEAYLQNLLQDRIKMIETQREKIVLLERTWKAFSKSITKQEDEGLWHQPDTTVGQLVIDYGSLDHAYIMPPEIAGLKLHISSQLTIPRSSWNDILEIVLASYGIGFKQLNTFVRQLYFLRLNQTGLTAICDSAEALQLLPHEARICYVISPPPTELRRIYQFLEKFVPQEQMTCQTMGSNIVVVGYVREILEINKMYQFLLTPKQKQEYRIIALQKGQSDEIAQILHSIFEGEITEMRSLHDGGGEKHLPFFAGEFHWLSCYGYEKSNSIPLFNRQN